MALRRKRIALVLRLSLGAALLIGPSVSDVAFGVVPSLQWVSPASCTDVRIGRRALTSKAGHVRVDSGLPSKFCSGSVTGPEGTVSSCKLAIVDASFQYVVCMRSQSGENLGGYECSYHGNGGGWECAPTDIGAGWCD